MSFRNRRRAAEQVSCAFLALTWCAVGLFTTACRGPTIGIVAPDQPITLNINITVEQEVRIKLGDDVAALLDREEGKVRGRGGEPGILGDLGQVLAESESAIDDAKAAGEVGERYDGLLGIVTPPGRSRLRELVDSVNATRLDVYADISSRHRAPLSDVQSVAAKARIEAAAVGEYVMVEPEVWRRR